MLNAKHNVIESDKISAKLFDLSELTTVDLSHNNLTEIPAHIATATSLIVLSLAHNNITTVRTDLMSNVCS